LPSLHPLASQRSSAVLRGRSNARSAFRPRQYEPIVGWRFARRGAHRGARPDLPSYRDLPARRSLDATARSLKPHWGHDWQSPRGDCVRRGAGAALRRASTEPPVAHHGTFAARPQDEPAAHHGPQCAGTISNPPPDITARPPSPPCAATPELPSRDNELHRATQEAASACHGAPSAPLAAAERAPQCRIRGSLRQGSTLALTAPARQPTSL